MLVKLGFDFIAQLQDEIDKKSIDIGNTYLLGPLMSTLRPRIITTEHIEQIKAYSQHLWNDAVKLEGLWRQGKLANYSQITQEEEEIAKLAPWQGGIALIAADGLFNFTTR